MPLQSTVNMLRKAQSEKYAIGLFDVHTLAGTLAVLEAAEEQRSPVIIAPVHTPRSAMAALIKALAAEPAVPIAIELDHGVDFDEVMVCIRAGFTDVMLDASARPYTENATLTREVVKAAHAAGVGEHLRQGAQQAAAAGSHVGESPRGPFVGVQILHCFQNSFGVRPGDQDARIDADWK